MQRDWIFIFLSDLREIFYKLKKYAQNIENTDFKLKKE